MVIAALERGPLALADLVGATGLPRPTAHRLAVALEAHDLVRRDADGRFCLGLRLATLGRQAQASFPLAALAAPAMERLRDETGESVQLFIRDRDRRICVASVESPSELRTIVALGAALPLDRGSAGRVLGGEPGRSRPNRRRWIQSVAEREAGVASVSAPVLDADGRLVAAVSVSGPIERLTRRPGARHGPAVVRAAAAVGLALR